MRKGKFSYPFIFVENPTDEITVLLEGMPQGDLPIVLLYSGRMVEAARVRKTPRILKRFLKLYEVDIVVEPGADPVRVSTVEELLEVGGFDWTLS